MTPAADRVYLIRHAETEWSRSDRHTGTTDLPLTDTGRRRARELEPLLAPVHLALILSSPLRRARQTTALAGFGERAVVDADLAEWNYGEYEGLTTEQIHQRAPGWMVFKDGGPGGETPAQVGARVDRVIARVQAADGDVALFGHGHVLRVLAARWLGLSVTAGSQFLLSFRHIKGRPVDLCQRDDQKDHCTHRLNQRKPHNRLSFHDVIQAH